MNCSHAGCRNRELTRQQSCRKGWGSFFDHCVNERHQVAVKNDKQESLDRSITSKTHKILFPLCPVLQRSQLDAWVQFQAQFMQKVAKQ